MNMPVLGVPSRGKRYCGGDISVDLNEGNPFDVCYVADQDTITLHLGPMSYRLGIATDQTEDVTTTAGQLGFAPAGAEVRSIRDTPGAQFINIRAPDMIWDSITETDGGPCQKHGLLGVSSQGAGHIAEMARRFMRSGFVGGRLAAQSLACLALTEVYGLCKKHSLEPKPTLLSPSILKRVVDYIDAELESDIGLPEIASVACLSAAHFSRVFKQTTGMPLTRYVVQRRVARARDLLDGTDEPVAEIAVQCGFSSQSHLTTSFKAITGTTPAAFRKAGRSQAPICLSS